MAKTPTPVADDSAQITRAAPKRGRPPRAIQQIEPDIEDARSAAPNRRQAPRPPREAPRDVARTSPRQGAVVVMGRDGEQLTRRRTSVGDVHDVPLNEIPKGWDYQWNLVTVANEEFREVQAQMQQNGWRPVPAKRHSGRWMPPGFDGAIIVKGLRLEERPTELGDEARAEDIAHARAQVRDQTDSLKLSQKLPDGMAISKKYRGTGGEVRLSVDNALDVPRPHHQLDE